MKRRSEIGVRDRRGEPLLSALWVKYALVPIEILQRQLFKEIARQQQRLTKGKS